MLKAACQKYRGTIDVDRALQGDGNEGSEDWEIAAPLGESLFYNKASAEEDGLDDIVECADFGDNVPVDIKAKLHERVQDAAAPALTVLGQHALA